MVQYSMNWINKLFRKKEYNYKNNQKMEQVKDTPKKYQWKKGENFGKVVEVKERDDKFTYFTDGSQIFNNVLKEFMEEVVDDKLPLPGADKLGAIAMGEAPQKLNESKTNPIKEVVEDPVEQEPITSAIEELVTKLSKKNLVPLEATINLNIPIKQVFDMLIENADEDREELINTIAKVAISQIEINKLQEYLTEEVTSFIKNYYE